MSLVLSSSALVSTRFIALLFPHLSSQCRRHHLQPRWLSPPLISYLNTLLHGLLPQPSKCKLLWPPSSPPPPSLVSACSSRGLCLVRDGLPTLGAIIGLDRDYIRKWTLG